MNLEIKMQDLIEFSESKTGKNISTATYLDLEGKDFDLGICGWPFKAVQGTRILESYINLNMKSLGLGDHHVVYPLSIRHDDGVLVLSVK